MSEGSITRRRLLESGVATGMALALPAAARAARPARATRPLRQRSVEVAIVGAGLAGLAAARELARAGRSVVVLEARDRVGGRTWNQDLGPAFPGAISEAGGTYVGPTQDRIQALASAVGVGTFDTYNQGDDLLYFDNQLSRYPANPGIPNNAGLTEAGIAFFKLQEMASTVSPSAPWQATSARDWDATTLGAWGRANIKSADGRTGLAVISRTTWGAEPDELSLLYVLFYIAAAGNEQNPGSFERLSAVTGGAQQSRFVGGSQRVSIEVARRLGHRVVLDAPVRMIEHHGRGVTVTADGIVVKAKRVIVAIPPVLSGEIDYRPALPKLRRALARHMPQGKLQKWTAVYERPFWREQGLSGQVFSALGPVNITYDNSPPSGKPGVIAGFIGGVESRRVARSHRARRAAMISNLVTYFGAEARGVREYFDQRWPQQVWSRGCPVGIFGARAMVRYGPVLREPVGRIHWAGTETSTFWMGFMDGAVRSGERAAAEVDGALPH